ncbi:MAG: HAD family phosphatase [Bdellovibrionales bacterium]|nr:HAD family phosphatase [Bdellovibrionales bacterium]
MVQQRGDVSCDWVVFDLGAVLIDWNPRYVYGRLTSDDSKIEHFLKEVATGEWNSQMDAGNLFQNAIDARALEFPEWRDWLQMWRDEWPTMMHGPILGTVEILKELAVARRQGRLKGILALSNWEANTFKIALARFPFLQEFDGRLISGEEKKIKPDPSFFALLESRYGVEPERAIFIDDLEKNTRVARDLGYRTHQFVASETGFQALRDELAALGLLHRKN